MGTDTLNIWCANIGWKWHDNWVRRLQRMVEQNCSIPYRFRCISDHEIDGVEVQPFSREIIKTEHHHSRTRNQPQMVLNEGKPQGCWAKVDVWKAPLGTYNLLLDLDVCVVSDLAQLVSVVPAAARDCRHTASSPWMNGSCVSWKSTEHTQNVYPRFIPYREFPRGEQEYVQKALGGFIPFEGVYSFKCHLTGKTRQVLPEDAVVIFFHGHPTPASDKVQDLGWISKTWRGIERIERV